jgi:hypothetical protein
VTFADQITGPDGTQYRGVCDATVNADYAVAVTLAS